LEKETVKGNAGVLHPFGGKGKTLQEKGEYKKKEIRTTWEEKAAKMWGGVT